MNNLGVKSFRFHIYVCVIKLTNSNEVILENDFPFHIIVLRKIRMLKVYHSNVQCSILKKKIKITGNYSNL